MAAQESNTEDTENARGESSGVGALLRASRLRLGDNLRSVAESLHIRFIYLEAIEAGRYEDLPGTAYAIGFIRSYADYLGLDSDEVVRRYKAESRGESGNARLVFPVPIPESSIPGGAIIFIGVVVALLTYGVWYVSTAKDGFLAGLVSQVPERLSEQKPVEEPEVMPEPVTAVVPEPAPEVAQKEEITEPVEQVTAEIEKEVVEPVSEPVLEVTAEPMPEVTPEPAPEVAEVVAEVTAEVEPEQQTVVAEVVEKVEQVEEAVANEVAVSATPPEPEPAPVVEPAAVEQVVAENTPSEPVLESPAVVQAIAEEPQPAPEPQTPAPAESASTSSSNSTSASTSTSTSTSSSTTTPSSSGQVYGAENEKSRILVKARKNSWIQVRDNNANRLLLTRLLRAGDSYRVPDQPGLILLTGNAGALEILVDGEAVPDLGEAGKVRRNVTLDPDLLRQGTAAN